MTLKIDSKASLGLSPIVTTSVKPPEKTVQLCFRYENFENQWEPNKLLAGKVREPDERGRCLQFLAAAEVLQRRKPNSTFFLSTAGEQGTYTLFQHSEGSQIYNQRQSLS